MSDPSRGGWQARKAHRKEVMQRAHAHSQEVNQELAAAREVYGPKHPTVKKLVADSVEAVAERSKAVKDYQEGM